MCVLFSILSVFRLLCIPSLLFSFFHSMVFSMLHLLVVSLFFVHSIVVQLFPFFIARVPAKWLFKKANLLVCESLDPQTFPAGSIRRGM